MHIAVKTLAKINQMLEADQGAAYRQQLKRVLPHIGDIYREEEEGFRAHLGASIIGGDCVRSIWYSFRWALKQKFEGRMVRLFNRGHIEEARVIALLLMIGVRVYQQDAEGKQFRIRDVNGHFGGSGDGVVIDLPDLAAEQPALLECKTSNEKSFAKLKQDGVKEAKPEHYVQMNIYMHKMGIAVALYVCVNKNDDHIHMELVPYDREIALQYLGRAEQVIASKSAPQKLNESPGYWKCRFCDHAPICHMKAVPDVNCRTCKYAFPAEDGVWQCTRHNFKMDAGRQLLACENYERAF